MPHAKTIRKGFDELGPEVFVGPPFQKIPIPPTPFAVRASEWTAVVSCWPRKRFFVTKAEVLFGRERGDKPLSRPTAKDI